jgi:hypothetical protein
VLSIDGVYTLVNFVIVKTTQVNLVLWAIISCGVIVIVAAQVKNDFYHDRFMTNMFLPRVVDVFECLH